MKLTANPVWEPAYRCFSLNKVNKGSKVQRLTFRVIFLSLILPVSSWVSYQSSYSFFGAFVSEWLNFYESRMPLKLTIPCSISILSHYNVRKLSISVRGFVISNIFYLTFSPRQRLTCDSTLSQIQSKREPFS